MSAAQDETIDQIANNMIARLSEHCESVLILITAKDGTSTKGRHYLNGNFYASLGLAHEWLAEQDERVRVYRRKKDDE